ncbi:hypothetical protein SAMN05192530_107115 [Aureimonas jatrophae]|uniref:Anti-sigma factor NepR domain-containing protein n=1 Tax=Aureimonas jatrophae TaxID=1166073 RepID=A0A1H0K6J7_9HYPH|nr:hypothetical protein SAMN05192530_107115 [Aureimonas jatrophae]
MTRHPHDQTRQKQERAVRELSGTLTNQSLQGKVRQALSHTHSFRTDDDLPEFLRSKLDELDRVTTKRQ